MTLHLMMGPFTTSGGSGAWERLQGDAVVHLVKGKTDAEAGEFDQVACAIVILSPEGALTSVDLNRLVFAANEHVFLNGWQRLIGFEFGPAIALLGRWGEDFDYHGWIGEHGAGLLATGYEDIWVEIAFLGELHAGVTGVGSTRLAPQRPNEQIDELRTNGGVSDTATSHVNHGLIVIGGGRWA